MAAQYMKCETRVTVSRNSDYSDPIWVYEPETPETQAQEAVERIDNLEIGTGAETLMRTDRYSTLKKFYVKNKDSSNYVTLITTGLAGTTRSIRILANSEVTLPDVDPTVSPTLQANSAAVLVDIIMTGES